MTPHSPLPFPGGKIRRTAKNYRRSKTREGFSLLELLIVMTITGLLSCLVAVSLGTADSAALSGNGNAVFDALSLARQEAVSRDTYTAMVIMTNGAGAYNSYCLMELPKNSDGTYNTNGWSGFQSWQTLASGVVFSPSDPSTFLTTPTPSALPATLPASYSYHGKSLDLASTCTAQIFRPDGTLIATNQLRLRIVRGSWNGSSVTSPRQTNYYDIVIVPDTGATQVERL
jgi:prepilin-type N-terminal cleavage/methylation domain-containing protein